MNELRVVLRPNTSNTGTSRCTISRNGWEWLMKHGALLIPQSAASEGKSKSALVLLRLHCQLDGTKLSRKAVLDSAIYDNDDGDVDHSATTPYMEMDEILLCLECNDNDNDDNNVHPIVYLSQEYLKDHPYLQHSIMSTMQDWYPLDYSLIRTTRETSPEYVELTEIIINARGNREAYFHMTSSNLTRLSNKYQDSPIHIGQLVSMDNYQYRVIHTTPVFQGLFTPNTNIIVVNTGSDDVSYDAPVDQPLIPPMDVEMDMLTDVGTLTEGQHLHFTLDSVTPTTSLQLPFVILRNDAEDDIQRVLNGHMSYILLDGQFAFKTSEFLVNGDYVTVSLGDNPGVVVRVVLTDLPKPFKSKALISRSTYTLLSASSTTSTSQQSTITIRSAPSTTLSDPLTHVSLSFVATPDLVDTNGNLRNEMVQRFEWEWRKWCRVSRVVTRDMIIPFVFHMIDDGDEPLIEDEEEEQDEDFDEEGDIRIGTKKVIEVKVTSMQLKNTHVPHGLVSLATTVSTQGLVTLCHTLIPPPHSSSSVSTELYNLFVTSRENKAHSIILLHGPRDSGKKTIIRQCSEYAGIPLLEINVYELLTMKDAKSYIINEIQRCKSSHFILVLRNIDALPRPELMDEIVSAKTHMTCIATTEDIETVDKALRRKFDWVLSLPAPTFTQRCQLLRSMLQHTLLPSDVSIEHLATNTAAFQVGDLSDLIHTSLLSLPSYPPSSHPYLPRSTLLTQLEKARKQFGARVGAPKIPDVRWDDIGGLEDVKLAIQESLEMGGRKGILLYGPPGTGKTLIAKAVANESGMNFLSVKGPELLNMYVGESEANVRRIFQRARDAKPCIIFMDEIDSVAPKRGQKGDSGGVMDRIVSQLLAEMDGNDNKTGGKMKRPDVFVIAATNRPDLVDEALLRPGRFDKLVYLGVSKSKDAQEKVLRALTRKFHLSSDFSYQRVTEMCPDYLTGADMYALCSDALLKSMIRSISHVDNRMKELGISSTEVFFDKYANEEDMKVVVTEDDFVQAMNELTPSVGREELERYERIRTVVEGGSKQDENVQKQNGTIDSDDGVDDREDDVNAVGNGAGQSKKNNKGKGKTRLRNGNVEDK